MEMSTRAINVQSDGEKKSQMRPKKYIVMLGKLMVAVNNFSIFIKNNLLSFFGHCSYTHFLLIYMKIFSIRINSLYQDVSHMTSQKGSETSIVAK